MLVAILTPVVGTQVFARQGAGVTRQILVHSKEYGRDRRVWVYTPPGYDARRKQPYPLFIGFDGNEAVDPRMMNMPGMLDSLLEVKSAPAFVGVFIDDSLGAARSSELGNSAKFGKFMAAEIIPYVRKNWNVTRDPHRTIVTGSSAGGIGSANLAFFYSEIFGNVISQSGAFWRANEGSNGGPFEWLTSQVAASAKKDIRFVMDVGSQETGKVMGGTGPVFIEANRRLRDVLQQKGYSVTYTEIPGGTHSVDSWRVALPGEVALITRDW